jgi:hypothetical protein
MASDSVGLPPNNEPNSQKANANGDPQTIAPFPNTKKGDRNPRSAQRCPQQKKSKRDWLDIKSKRDWLDIANFIVLVGAFFAAVGAAYEASRLANLTQAVINHTDQAAAIVNRPFIYSKSDVSFENVFFSDKKEFVFYATWVNSGNTATDVEFTTGGGVDTNVSPANPTNHAHFIIGPRAEHRMVHVLQTVDQFQKYYITPHIPFHVYGTAKYFDAISNAAREARETRFCMVSIGLTMTYESGAKTPTLHGIAEPCDDPGTNCTNEECEKYPPRR